MDYSEILTDMNKHIWSEVTYLRCILMKLVEKNPTLAENFTKELIDEAREMAQEIMLEKFSQLTRKNTKVDIKIAKA